MAGIVVLGASGLIGHKLFEQLSRRFNAVTAVLHRDRRLFAACRLFAGDNVCDNVDVREFSLVGELLDSLNPDVVLNCAGITKRRAEINQPLTAIEVNSLFPHRLAQWAGERGKRIIHFSTDCVFDGALGDYTEDSHTTGIDPYGQTKALGEIQYNHTLTIRSSFIGRELDAFSELLEWLIGQQGQTIRGFTEAWYSGVSTIFMSRVIGDIIESYPTLDGLCQLATPQPISKFELLCVARDAFGLDIEIIPDDSLVAKPTLNGTKLSRLMNLQIPDWPTMMRELADDNLYDHLNRTKHVSVKEL